ncbi:MAG: TetR family transcriptional regulator [Acidobacteria bacterium]|nr:TetR family transcriptional regulator [Acidobacteriota bacterium]
MTRKLTMGRDSWVQAAVAAFRRGGRGAVRIDALAKEAGITRGSFYHHFKDRAELLQAVLGAWESETRDGIRNARLEDAPGDRLRAFFRRAQETEADYPPDVEILAWAREDPAVAKLAKKVERRRLDFIRRELIRAGVESGEARRRAEFAYLATQGWVFQAGYGARRSRTRTAFTADLFDLILRDVG